MSRCTCGSYATNIDPKEELCDVCFYRHHAMNLLAVIHRDGGHHTTKVGFKKSCTDAEDVVLRLLHKED